MRRYAMVVLVLTLGLILVSSPHASFLKASETDQIKFSHAFHIKEAGIECATCHAAAQTSKTSSDNLHANHDNCITCHEEQVTNTCGYCHSSPDNIASRITPARELKFSHEQHLSLKDVECKACHANVESAETVTAQLLPEMAACNTCHNNRNVTNTCESCHTDFAALIPVDHRRSDFRRNHRDQARLGALETDCQSCHTETFCQQCHQGLGLKKFGRTDLSADPSPKRSTKDSPNQTVLQNVHELNYRFTHGIDAKGRSAECASCHSTQEFCVQCHDAGGNVTQARFKPSSHSVPGFTTIGRGSGGGLHAEEARRDIENCISCHDVEGRDPSCMTCHAESGSVR
jgi:hypothetical protein